VSLLYPMTLLNVQLRRLLLLCDHRNKTDLRRDKDTFSRQMSCKFYCHQWKVWHILQHCLWHNTVCRFLLKICTLVDTKFFSSNLIWIYLKKDCNCISVISSQSCIRPLAKKASDSESFFLLQITKNEHFLKIPKG
jgi:hypothetical protein